jgi:hypothetical protein
MNSQGASNSVEFMQCAAVTPSDEEDSFHGSSCDESSTMLEAGSEFASETEDKEELAEPDVVTCDLWGQAPCEWDAF